MAEAEAPKGSMYFHFPGGKAELAAAAVDHFGERIHAHLVNRLATSPTVRDAVAGFFDSYVEHLEATRFAEGCAVATVALDGAAQHDVLAEATGGARRPAPRARPHHLTGERPFARVAAMSELRWEQVDEPKPQGSLFDEPVFERQPGRAEFRGIDFLHVRSHRIINEVRGAPFGFRYTINAYRGCSHACTYCFARPSHTYLDLDADRDFERSIVVKVNAVSLLRREIDPRRWAGDLIAMGTNTDPYQRAEGKYRLTRGIVEVLTAAANPFSILTKSTLVLRDLHLLTEAAQRTDVRVNLSIGTLDEGVWRATEPGTPHPRRRVRAVQQLNAAGVPCGVLLAPVLPGLSDAPEQLEAVVAACVEAGARSISTVLLHLRPGVKDVYLSRLAETHPHLVADVRRRYRDRAYAPRADREALDALVHDLVRQHGGVAAARTDARHHAGRGATPGSPDHAEERAVAAPRRPGSRGRPGTDDAGDSPTTQLSLL